MVSDFGHKHLTGLLWLCSLILVALIILLIIRKKKNLGEAFDKSVIRYTLYFMCAWEIVKTIRLINYEDYGPVGYYPLWMAPFHLCSMGFYAYMILSAEKKTKLEEFIKPFSYAALMIGALISLVMPASAGLLGHIDNWSLCFDNILPYQTWCYHGSLLFVSLYMVLSGYYSPRIRDIFKGVGVLAVTAAFSQSINYILEGSGADFMTLRYGNGNPFAYLLQGENPIMYYVVLAAVAFGGIAVIIFLTVGIKALARKMKNK